MIVRPKLEGWKISMGGFELRGLTQDYAPKADVQETFPNLGSTLRSRENTG